MVRQRSGPSTNASDLLLGIRNALLPLHFFELSLQITQDILLLRCPRHEPRRILEEVVHLFQWPSCRLGQDRPEEERVREVADHEEDVELVPDVRHSDRRDLADHGVEGEGHHACDRHPLRPGPRIEHLGRDDPGQRSAGTGEREVVDPRDNDETPLGASVRADTRWVFGEEGGRDDKSDHVSQVAPDQRPATPEPVNKQYAEKLGDQGDNGVDRLVLKCILPADTCNHPCQSMHP